MGLNQLSRWMRLGQLDLGLCLILLLSLFLFEKSGWERGAEEGGAGELEGRVSNQVQWSTVEVVADPRPWTSEGNKETHQSTQRTSSERNVVKQSRSIQIFSEKNQISKLDLIVMGHCYQAQRVLV